MDSMWWAVWWPWMLVWTVTLVAAIAAIGFLVVQFRRRKRPTPGISLYLHKESVMELYLRGRYKPALRQEVQEKITSSKNARIIAQFPGFGGEGDKKVNREVFRTYIDVEEAITVIILIMDVLDNANDVVYVDLIDNTVESGKALSGALDAAHSPRNSQLSFSRLRDLEVYVSVRGRFREVAKNAETITFAASCGPGEPGPQPQATLTCVVSGLRREVAKGTFSARCLGRIQDWNTETRELVIDPIAIFQ